MSREKGIFMFVLALFLVINVKTVKAENLSNNISNIELQGNTKGIVFIPGEEPFLCGTNMLPGDKISREINISNKYNVPYKLYMRAERVTEKESYDLLQKINLKITYGDKILYKGPVSGENGLIKNVDLGTINPNEFKKLNAEVVLDGTATGNEYKNKFGQVNWIFTAVNVLPDGATQGTESDDGQLIPNDSFKNNNNEDKGVISNVVNEIKRLPQTGQDIVLIYIPLGIIALVAGIMLSRKGGKTDGKKNP